MKIKNNVIKKCVLYLGMMVGFLFFSKINANQVYAASEKFYYDNVTIAVEDGLYLPYLGDFSDGVEFFSDDPSNNPVAWFWSNMPEHFGYDAIIGNKPGTITIIADAPNGKQDTMTVTVVECPYIIPNTNVAVDFRAGLIKRSFQFTVPEKEKYRITMEGPAPCQIDIFRRTGGVYAYQSEWEYTGSSYRSSLDVELEPGMEYYLTLYALDAGSFDMTAPNCDMVYNVSVNSFPKASEVSLNVNAYALKVENNTYYMLEGDSFDVKVVQGGVPDFQKVYYEVGTTNSAVATITNFGGEDNYMINCRTAGEVDVSVTTANMLTDSFKLIVLGKNQLVPGDMDLDGIITKADIVNVFLGMTGQTEKNRNFYHADVNGDGMVTEIDIAGLWESIGGLPFVDVSEADWFYKAVEYNYNEGIMTGMNSIQFGPYESLSRAQFALILYRMQGTPEVTEENPFKDIVGNEWYADAVLWAYDNGIVTGFGDNTFRPADLITREQMVAMMYRYANYLEEDTTKKEAYDHFIDASNVSEYADEAMQWAVGNGILTGKNSEEGAMLAPWGATARAEAVVIIQRFMD